MNTHYSRVMDAELLLSESSGNARKLVEVASRLNKCPLLVYRGMSGVGYATGLAMCLIQNYRELKFGQFYVRKDEEKSHSHQKYEVYADEKRITKGPSVFAPLDLERTFRNYFPVFVDDFICTGRTMVKCMIHLPFWKPEEWMILCSSNESYNPGEYPEDYDKEYPPPNITVKELWIQLQNNGGKFPPVED